MGRDSPPRKTDASADPPAGAFRASKLRSVLTVIAVAAAVVVAAAYATVLVAPAPRADATLRQTGAHPDDQLLLRMESEGGETGFRPKPGYGGHDQEIELSTLSAFGAFRGFELWSAVNAFESPCLIAYHRATDDIVARSCVPSGADLFVDTQSHGLGPGQRLRFQLRGDTVDAFVLRPAGAE